MREWGVSCRWAANGPASWQGLRELHLDANKLRGTLPASWGDKGSFPQLINLTLANNDLSGSLPAQWGLDATTFMTRFPRLQSMTLLPGRDPFLALAFAPILYLTDTQACHV